MAVNSEQFYVDLPGNHIKWLISTSHSEAGCSRGHGTTHISLNLLVLGVGGAVGAKR